MTTLSMRRRLGVIIVLAIATLSSGCASLVAPRVNAEAAALRPGAYRLDPDHAALLFRIDHLGYSKYVGRFEKFDATLDFDQENPGAARLSAIVDVTSLDVANEEFAETLIGSNWFDTERFPQAIFELTNLKLTGDQKGQMTGDLTLKGETAPVTLDVTFNGGARDLLRGAYVIGFSANGVFDRTTFGVDRFAGVVGEEVEIEIEAEFIRQ